MNVPFLWKGQALHKAINAKPYSPWHKQEGVQKSLIQFLLMGESQQFSGNAMALNFLTEKL